MKVRRQGTKTSALGNYGYIASAIILSLVAFWSWISLNPLHPRAFVFDALKDNVLLLVIVLLLSTFLALIFFAIFIATAIFKGRKIVLFVILLVAMILYSMLPSILRDRSYAVLFFLYSHDVASVCSDEKHCSKMSDLAAKESIITCRKINDKANIYCLAASGSPNACAVELFYLPKDTPYTDYAVAFARQISLLQRPEDFDKFVAASSDLRYFEYKFCSITVF